MKYKVCTIIGCTPETLKDGYDEDSINCIMLKAALAEGILEQMTGGCHSFISTLNQGAEMWGAEICSAIKQKGGKIELAAIQTGEDQANRWHPERRNRYFDLIEKADNAFICGGTDGYTDEDYITDNSDVILVLGDDIDVRGASIIMRACMNGIEIKKITAQSF